MHKLAIISSDHKAFEEMFIADINLHTIYELIYSGTEPPNAILNEVEVLIGEPSLLAPLIEKCLYLKWVQSTWAGNNKLQGLTNKSYILTGVKNVFGLQMVEYILAYMLFFTRRINEFNQLKESGDWEQLPCLTLSNYNVTIFGMGSIGKQVANQLSVMGMQVAGIVKNIEKHSQAQKLDNNIKIATYQESISLVNKSDFVINLLPETAETTGLFNSKLFSQFKAGAIFINAGRGNVIDKPDSLIEALKSNHLKAAVLDVFENEPLDSQHEYYNTDNLYITCHTAAISHPSEVFKIFRFNAIKFSENQPLQYVHDFELGY